MSHAEIRVSRNIPPGFKPKKLTGFCRGSKQDTIRCLGPSIENAGTPSTYNSRSLIFDHLAKLGPVGSWVVAFGKFPINLALERIMVAMKIALGVVILITFNPGGYVLVFRCHVDVFGRMLQGSTSIA